jgi:hypothetical protein
VHCVVCVTINFNAVSLYVFFLIFLEISYWKIFCHLRTNDQRLYQQFYFGGSKWTIVSQIMAFDGLVYYLIFQMMLKSIGSL